MCVQPFSIRIDDQCCEILHVSGFVVCTQSDFIERVEGKNLAVEYRFAEGHIERLPGLARELVGHGVIVIAAGGPPTVLAAKSATSTIPIVAAGFDDDTQRLVGNLSHPDGNLTGFTTFEGADIYGKRLELLHELIPGVRSIAMMVNPNDRNEVKQGEIAAAARGMDFEISFVSAADDPGIEAAIATAADRHVDALLVSSTPAFTVWHAKIAARPRAKQGINLTCDGGNMR